MTAVKKQKAIQKFFDRVQSVTEFAIEYFILYLDSINSKTATDEYFISRLRSLGDENRKTPANT